MPRKTSTHQLVAGRLVEALRKVYPRMGGLDGVTDAGLAKVPAAQRSVLGLRYLSCPVGVLSNAKVAALLGTTVEKVRELEFRAFRKLELERPRRASATHELFGELLTIGELAELSGVGWSTMYQRLARMPAVDAVAVAARRGDGRPNDL